jgi:hypothetical protein
MVNPIVWGTYGQWVSAIGTTLAFSATFFVIRRDAKVRRYAQARKVALYVERTDREPHEVEGKHKAWYTVHLKNLSDEPIYDAMFFMRQNGRRGDNLGGESVIMPGAERLYRSGYSISEGSLDAWFRDNSGKWWDRDLRGALTEKSRFRHWLEINFFYGWGSDGGWNKFKRGIENIRFRRSLRG